MKEMWVGYNDGCTMGLLLGHSAWQIDQPSNGSIWNSYSVQPVGPWMSYLFTDLGVEGVVVLWMPCYHLSSVCALSRWICFIQLAMINKFVLETKFKLTCWWNRPVPRPHCSRQASCPEFLFMQCNLITLLANLFGCHDHVIWNQET